MAEHQRDRAQGMASSQSDGSSRIGGAKTTQDDRKVSTGVCVFVHLQG